MRFSTRFRVAAVLLLVSPVAMAQSSLRYSTLDRASTAQVLAKGGTFTPAEATPPVLGDNRPASLLDLAEGFDAITTLPAAGWSLQNLSAPVGSRGWFQGNPDVFPAQSGATNSYIGANFNSTAGTGVISNWLITPQTALENGSTLKFYTRTTDGAPFADRLEVRLSTAGASTNVGATATSVGDFTTLLLTVNEALADSSGSYPDVWTEYTATVSGLAAPAMGRFAFRYTVTNGGPAGANSNYIGIDNVRLTVTGPTGPALTASPASFNFGTTTPVNKTSAPVSVRLTNGGTAPVTITSVTGSGAPFTVNTTGTMLTLAPGASTVFTVAFAPTTGTAVTGTVTVASNAAGSPLVINLAGKGFVPPTAPANDNIANAIVLTGTTGTLTGTNVAATTQTGEVAPTCQTAYGNSVWWTYTPTVAGRLSVDLSATAFDTILTFHQPGTTQIGCDDDGADLPNGVASILRDIPVAAGSPVLIRVAGYFSSFTGTQDAGAISGTFTFVATTAGEGTAADGRTSLTASPNPVRDAARVRFTTATAQDVTVAVYDVTGRQVATLFQGAVAADQTIEARLDAANLPSGVYVVRATGTDVNLVQQVTVIR